jgi:hypothetical protein
MRYLHAPYGPAITAHGSLDLEQEIQIQIQIQMHAHLL